MNNVEIAKGKFKHFMQLFNPGNWICTSQATTKDGRSEFEAWLNNSTGRTYVVQYFNYTDDYFLFLQEAKP